MTSQQSPRAEVFRIVTDLIRGLTDDPDTLHFSLSEPEPGRRLIEVVAPAREYGRIIGVSGRTARAIRTLLTGLGAAEGIHYSFDVRASDDSKLKQ